MLTVEKQKMFDEWTQEIKDRLAGKIETKYRDPALKKIKSRLATMITHYVKNSDTIQKAFSLPNSLLRFNPEITFNYWNTVYRYCRHLQQEKPETCFSYPYKETDLTENDKAMRLKLLELLDIIGECLQKLEPLDRWY